MINIVYTTNCNGRITQMHFDGHANSNDALSRKICIGLTTIVLGFCHHLRKHYSKDEVLVNINAKHPTMPSINDIDIYFSYGKNDITNSIMQFDSGLDWLIDNGGKYYINKVVK